MILCGVPSLEYVESLTAKYHRHREQPVEASGSCPLKDLIKLEKPVRFEAAIPPYNADVLALTTMHNTSAAMVMKRPKGSQEKQPNGHC